MATAWNTSYSSWWTYSNSNFSVKRNNLAQYYRNISANMKFAVGKYYIEVAIADAANGNYTGVSVGRNFTFVPPTGALGSDAEEWAYRANGDLITGGTTQSGWGSSWTYGDVIGIAYQVTTQGSNTGKVWFSKNGVWQASGDPANGTNPAYSTLYGWGIYIMCWCGYYIGTKFTIISDYQSQNYTMPSGFTDWDGNTPPLWTDKEIDAPVAVGASIQIAAQTFEDDIDASVSLGVSMSRYKLLEDSIAASVILGDGMVPAIERQLSFEANIKSKVHEPEWFDYLDWYLNQKDRSQLKYFLTMRDSREDDGVDVPMIGFDMTIRGVNYSFVSATISYQSIDDFLLHSNYMEISFVYYIEGQENLRVKLFEGEVERINFDQYKTINLVSFFRFHTKLSPQNFPVRRESLRKDNDTYWIRVVDPDPFMRPGDQITDEDEDSYLIDVIRYSFGPGYFVSEITCDG